jgi:SAM-dependent methyltransferase
MSACPAHSTSTIRQGGDYYERHAKGYARSTSLFDLSGLYGHFLRYLPLGAYLLDAGSGSGRDTLAFLRCGYQVDAFDASAKLCALSTKLTGKATWHVRFQEFCSLPTYDGIWACASLLHVPAAEMRDSVGRLIAALKPGGIFYLSFKYGHGERWSPDGRFYLDMTEDGLRNLLHKFSGVEIVEIWRWAPQPDLADGDEWLNAIVRKKS